MKRLILIFLALYLVLSSVAFAQSVTPAPSPVEYQLPYPGILPDNFLYDLKTLRDRIIGFFISDPIKKSEFDLLQADKRLSMGVALSQEGKYDLAETTISKGENYFYDAIKSLKMGKIQGRTLDGSLLSNMELSAKKHNEIIRDIQSKTKGDLEKRLDKDSQRAEDFLRQVEDIKPK